MKPNSIPTISGAELASTFMHGDDCDASGKLAQRKPEGFNGLTPASEMR